MKSGVVYTLQKLPDFELWILIAEPTDLKGKIWPTSWMSINEYSATPMGAFGGCYHKFVSVTG